MLANTSQLFSRRQDEKKAEEELQAKDWRIDQLDKEVGQLTVQVNWAKKKLSSLDSWTTRFLIEKDSHELDVKTQCRLLGLKRSSVYYQPRPTQTVAEREAAMHQIQEKAPSYGYRRMTMALRRRQGFEVGEKRVRRLCRQLGLKALFPGRKTTVPHPPHRKYPYLLRGLPIERPNQVWASDMTYLRTERGFMYRVTVIDWYSRKVLAQRFSTTLDKRFCIEAVQGALERYGAPDIFNSDQGCQYTRHEMTGLLAAHGVRISMNGAGRCADNVIQERIFRTVKYEAVYLKSYESVSEMKQGVTAFLGFYNQERLHSSLDYMTPDEVYFANFNQLHQKLVS